jgi:hypothetical protein
LLNKKRLDRKKRSSQRNSAAQSALFYTTTNALSAKLSTTLAKRDDQIGQNAEFRIEEQHGRMTPTNTRRIGQPKC